MGRTEEWTRLTGYAVAVVGRLLELQEDFECSLENVPEAFADSPRARFYDEVVNVDLGAVHHALLELYDAEKIEP
jgi:hypothetical protein